MRVEITDNVAQIIIELPLNFVGFKTARFYATPSRALSGINELVVRVVKPNVRNRALRITEFCPPQVDLRLRFCLEVGMDEREDLAESRIEYLAITYLDN